MTNSRYRCIGCKEYHPAPPHRKIGLGGVCCEVCMHNVAGKRNPSSAARSRQPPKRDEVPPAVRRTVMQRDRDRCRWCGSTAVHLHHINYRSEGVDHSPHNLITLCGKHHDIVHSSKRHWKPILLAVIWEWYTTGRSVTVPQMHRRLERV